MFETGGRADLTSHRSDSALLSRRLFQLLTLTRIEAVDGKFFRVLIAGTQRKADR